MHEHVSACDVPSESGNVLTRPARSIDHYFEDISDICPPRSSQEGVEI